MESACWPNRTSPWNFGATHELALEAVGAHLRAWVDGRLVFELDDKDRTLKSGAVALLCKEGRTATNSVRVQPA